MTVDLINIAIFIFVISLTFCSATFGLYGFFLLLSATRRTIIENVTEISFYPFISIILPTFNEGKFIETKINNLFNTIYNIDKIEVIITDDSTEKSSRELIDNIVSNYPNIHLNRSDERRGYNKAMLDGIKQAKAEILIITDGGSLYDKDTIPQLIKPLYDQRIGGVTGKANIINKNERMGSSESFYRRFYNFMRNSESKADSTFHFHGEVSSVRKKLLKSLPLFSTNLDIAIAFQIRKKGYRVIFNPNANFFEYSPKSFNERTKQKSTRAIGVIQVILGNKSIFSLKNGIFGIIIYPAHFSMMIICPLFILAGSISFPIIIIKLITVLGVNFLVLPLLVILIIFVFKKELLINVIQLEYVLLIAIWKAFRNKSETIFIEKIDSTRR